MGGRGGERLESAEIEKVIVKGRAGSADPALSSPSDTVVVSLETLSLSLSSLVAFCSFHRNFNPAGNSCRGGE